MGWLRKRLKEYRKVFVPKLEDSSRGELVIDPWLGLPAPQYLVDRRSDYRMHFWQFLSGSVFFYSDENEEEDEYLKFRNAPPELVSNRQLEVAEGLEAHWGIPVAQELSSAHFFDFVILCRYLEYQAYDAGWRPTGFPVDLPPLVNDFDLTRLPMGGGVEAHKARLELWFDVCEWLISGLRYLSESDAAEGLDFPLDHFQISGEALSLRDLREEWPKYKHDAWIGRGIDVLRALEKNDGSHRHTAAAWTQDFLEEWFPVLRSTDACGYPACEVCG